ncbi:hypothetical protein HF1_02130 [Mycoplasma haemofelis str. Langford 1]|uniref:Uncharacterized protein n=1 Tax=Mycoplasma haemofelis (strain Langford 1) TaxID=941640 RepID=E8ZKQ5_MYCHL|nr:hypothetical protein [Mycoplasma haemofelis]CBY92221.1 hypothetical protein HF1_02130 [Mycoplasma haemofelis str. Langford 1]
MSSSLAFKAAAGTMATGGVAGGGYLIHSHVSNKTLNKDILSQREKKALPKGDSRWGVAFSKYQKKSKSDNQYQTSPASTTSNELENWCLKGLDSPHEEKLYSKIEKICTVPSISEYLETQSKTLLTTFTDKESSYKSHNQDDNLLIPKEEIGAEKAQVTSAQIQQWCTSSISKEFKDASDVLYKRVEKWCLNG